MLVVEEVAVNEEGPAPPVFMFTIEMTFPALAAGSLIVPLCGTKYTA